MKLIYSDDPNAIEKLEKHLKWLLAERKRNKAINNIRMIRIVKTRLKQLIEARGV
jgi:hypothetical protein